VGANGKIAESALQFNTVELDLLWEALTSTPFNYKGKALTSSESLIKVSAIPNFGGISASRLFYEWQLNNKKMLKASGLGKDTFTFQSSKVFNIDSVKVIVSDMNKESVISKRIRIKINEPKLIFYEEHPLKGPLYEKALGTELNLLNNELALRAEPYFFSKVNLLYDWKMNGKKN